MKDKNNLWLFNTFTRKKEPFVPLKKNFVKIYTCGPTVYDFAHIGNFRAFIFEDVLRRWIEHIGFRVNQVMNITDVDDKTIKASQKHKITLKKYTEYYTKAFFKDIETLNIKKAEHYPKATEHISEMVSLIKKLLKMEYAYRGDDNSIYYSVLKFKDYGKLSKMDITSLKSGARIKKDNYGKSEAQDFALWKTWEKKDGDVFWETELGKGRPGWHIECSAMAMKYLGETFDIHCGGIDNIFPHHENEIAQSEAITGKKFVNYWLHNEHLLVDGKKMSKSLGNYYTIRDLLIKGFNPQSIRYVLLSTHYRQQLNFTLKGLKAAEKTIERIKNLIQRLTEINVESFDEKIKDVKKVFNKEFKEAMNDDLNIPVALASFFNFIKDVNKIIDENQLSKVEAREVIGILKDMDNIFGFIGEIEKKEELSTEIRDLINKREKARKAKDWDMADQIRDKLRIMGIILEDTSQGVKWKTKNR